VSAPASQPATIVASDVVKTFGSGRNRHRALDGVSLTVSAGKSIGIVGESGSGKSTFARILCGLDIPSGGSVSMTGLPVERILAYSNRRRMLRSIVQFVAQDTNSSFDPRLRVIDGLRTPLRVIRGITGKDADTRIEDLLITLELDPSLANRFPDQLSGGQRQRVALARSLVVQPRILVCDEVVSALDVSVQGSVLNVLKKYVREHDAGLVFVSHGLPATAFISDEIVVMHNGRIVEHGSTQQVIEQPKDNYTRTLLDAYVGLGAADHESRSRDLERAS
jgi:ABC-type glutathione transport system ATPase component